MGRKLYCGINEDSFRRAYDPEKKIFDKSLIWGIRFPNNIFLYDPIFDIPLGPWRVIHGYCCGEIAEGRTREWGGRPFVFSVDVKMINDLGASYEVHKGKIRKRRVVLDSERIEVDSVYLVGQTIKNIGTLLRRIDDPIQNTNQENF